MPCARSAALRNWLRFPSWPVACRRAAMFSGSSPSARSAWALNHAMDAGILGRFRFRDHFLQRLFAEGVDAQCLECIGTKFVKRDSDNFRCRLRCGLCRFTCFHVLLARFNALALRGFLLGRFNALALRGFLVWHNCWNNRESDRRSLQRDTAARSSCGAFVERPIRAMRNCVDGFHLDTRR
jgi:hypothetical protein